MSPKFSSARRKTTIDSIVAKSHKICPNANLGDFHVAARLSVLKVFPLIDELS